jgi:TRIAD3 protein (E3 ubiquitin-protein ligase RNF216)
MSEYGDVLFVTHGALVKIQEDWEAGRPAKMSMKKSLTAPCPKYDRQHIQQTIAKESDPLKKELLQELHASRVALDAMNAAHESAQQALRMEEKKMSRARAAGNTVDCECCCSEYIVDELVSCDAEVAHVSCPPPSNTFPSEPCS